MIGRGQLGHDRRFEHLNIELITRMRKWDFKPSGKATSDVSVTCICESASQSSLFDKRTKVVFNENSSATGSETCARIGNVKSTAALGLPKNQLYHAFDKVNRSNLEMINDPKIQ